MRVKLCGNVVSDDQAGVYRYFGYTVCCPKDIRAAIETCPDGEELVLEVNSSGGSAYAGFEMYSLLRAYTGKTIAEVQSIAASAMSVIIAACDTVLMSPVAEVMIHRSSIRAEGNSRGMKQAAQMLDAIDESILTAYVEKAGGKSDREKLARMMRHETFLTAQEAIDCGLADGMIEAADSKELLPERAVACAGMEAPGVAVFDEEGRARPLKAVLEDLTRRISAGGLFQSEQLPPVEDLIRRKEEREGMDSHRQEGGVRDSLSGSSESGWKRNTGEEKENEDMAEEKSMGTPATPEQLVQMFPELTEQIMATAAAAERKRIAEIDAAALPGFEELIAKAKADPNATAGNVALEIVKAQRESGKAYLANRNSDAVESNVNAVGGTALPEDKTGGRAEEPESMDAAAKEAVALWKQTKAKEGET